MNAVNKAPEGTEERGSRLAEVVVAAMSDAAIKERSKQPSAEQEPVKEERNRLTRAEPFQPINPINRGSAAQPAKEQRAVKSERAAKSGSEQQQKPVLKNLTLETNGVPLGLVIQKAIEAARQHDEIVDGPGSTVVETTFKGSPITATAKSDPVEIAIDWTCHRLREYYDSAEQRCRKAEEDLRHNDIRQNWICALCFGLGVAFGWIFLLMFPGLTLWELGAHLLRLLHGASA
jgi:hypothetical protein